MFDERFAALSKRTSWREVEICMKVGLGLHAWLETSSLKYGQKSISSSFLLSLSQFGSELRVWLSAHGTHVFMCYVLFLTLDASIPFDGSHSPYEQL